MANFFRRIQTNFIACLFFSPLCGAVDTLYDVIEVRSSEELHQAVIRANQYGNSEIVLHSGTYQINFRIWLAQPNIVIRSFTGNPADVTLVGLGMKATPEVDNLIDVAARDISIIGITLRDAPNHLVQVHGPRDADHFLLKKSRLLNSFEQMLKVSTGPGENVASADWGIIRDSVFEYPAGIGPQYYIGGIDAHFAKNWLVEGNEFRNISSPEAHISEFAIHFWNGSEDITVTRNKIVDSDRGIGFGLKRLKPTLNGKITDNLIVHNQIDALHQDVGISLQNSPGTLVSGNTIMLKHSYPNAIEYRFALTTGVEIRDNIVNRKIARQNGAEATLSGNIFTSFD